MTSSRALLWAGAALLVATGAYLAAENRPEPLLLANVLLHLVLGIGLAVPFALWWWRRRGEPGVRLGGLLLLGSAAAGLLLVALGNRSGLKVLLWAHAVLGLAGLAVLLLAVPRPQRGKLWQASAAGLLLAVLVPVLAIAYRSSWTGEAAAFANPPMPRNAAEQAMGGAEGPFYPSPASTRNGGLVPQKVFTESQSCGRSGCHPDAVEQWSSSAHRFSGFDNPWYRATYEAMREARGPVAARWCAGCHTPAVLLSGAADRAPAEVAGTPLGEAGVSCTACHAISAVKTSIGQGSYEVGVPALYDLAVSDSALARWTHDVLLRVDPDLHRRSFTQPHTATAEMCSTCHAAHMDKAVNGYHWIGIFDDYDAWQKTSLSGESYIRAGYFPKPQSCVDCHMPHVPSEDAGGAGGRSRSHRFAAANTALPALRGDREQMKEVTGFLRSGAVALDLFSLAVAPVPGSGLEEDLYAPLNRLTAAVRRGEVTRLDAMVRTPGVGHYFPGGKQDLADAWLELKVTDNRGRVIFWSGREDADGVDPAAHRFDAMFINDRAQPVRNHEIWEARSLVSWLPIESASARIFHYVVQVPSDAGEELIVHARLNYRKLRPDFTRWAFSRLGLRPPVVPVVTVAEDTVRVKVVAPDGPRADKTRARGEPEVDFARWSDFGVALYRDGDRRAAQRAFQRAVELRPDDVQAKSNLAWPMQSLGDLAAAREILNKALAQDPEAAQAHFLLSNIARKEGKLEEEIASLRAAAAIYPRDAETRRQIGNLLFQKGEYLEAVKWLREAAAIEPQDSAIHLSLMQSYAALADKENSKRHREIFERLEPNWPVRRRLTRQFLEANPQVDKEQGYHEHFSIPLDSLKDGGRR